MKTFAMVAIASVIAGVAALEAQTTTVQILQPSQPSLISNESIQSADSPLVRAAKMNIATRKRAAGHTLGVLIDDTYLRTHRGRISEATSAAALPAPLPAENPRQRNPGIAPKVTPADRSAIEKQKAARQEQARAAAEMEEPYGGNDMEEDRAHQIMSQMPKQTQPTKQQPNRRP